MLDFIKNKGRFFIFWAFFCALLFGAAFLITLYDALKYAKAAIPVSVKIETDRDLELFVYRVSPSGKSSQVYQSAKNSWQISGNYVKKILLAGDRDSINAISSLEISYKKKKILLTGRELAALQKGLKGNGYDLTGTYPVDYSLLEIGREYSFGKSFIGKFKSIINWPGDIRVIFSIFLKSLFITLYCFCVFAPIVIITACFAGKNNSLTAYWEKHYYYFLILYFILYCIQVYINITFREPLLDESKYLIRAWWNITGKMPLFGDAGATKYMPLYYVLLGIWQLVFGKGFISSQLFSAFLGVANLALMFIIINKLTKSKLISTAGIFFFFACPAGLTYFCVAAPYSLITFFSMLVIIIFIYYEKMPLFVPAVLLGLLFGILFLTRRNLLIGLALTLCGQLFICKRFKVLSVICTFGVFLISCWIITRFFHENLVYDMFMLPVIDRVFIKILKLVADPYSKIGGGIQRATVFQTMSETGFLDKVISYTVNFFRYFAVSYLPVVTFLPLSLYLIIKRKITAVIFFIISYFIIMLALHFYISQSISEDVIIPYTNYFLLFGCIGAAIGFKVFTEYLRKTDLTFFKKSICYSLLGVLGVVFIINYINNEPELSGSYLSKYKKVTSQIKESVADEKVLILGGLYTSINTAYLADKIYESSTINAQFSYKGKLVPGLTEERKREVLHTLRAAGFWANESFEQWVTSEYDYIIVGKGAFYSQHFISDQWLDLIDGHFIKINEITTRHDRKLEIYKRK